MPRSFRGIKSKEDFGTTTQAFSGLYLLAAAIGSAALVPGPTLIKKLQFALSVGGVTSGAAMGTPAAIPGGRNALPSGIASAAAIGGALRVTPKQYPTPSGIASLVALGTPNLTKQQFLTGLTGLASSAALGASTLIRQPILTVASSAVMDPAGGHTLVLTGQYLTGVTSVLIGGTSCAFSANTSTSVTVTTPAKTFGNYSIVVTTAGGTSNQLSIESWDPRQDSRFTNYWDSRYGLSLSGSNVLSWTDRTGGLVASSAAGHRPTVASAALANEQAVVFSYAGQTKLTLNAAMTVTGAWIAMWGGKWGTGNSPGTWAAPHIEVSNPIITASNVGSIGLETDGFGQRVIAAVENAAVEYKFTDLQIPVDNATVNVCALESNGNASAEHHLAPNWSASRPFLNGSFGALRSGSSTGAEFYDMGNLLYLAGNNACFFEGSLGFILWGRIDSTVGHENADSGSDAQMQKVYAWAKITFGAA